MKRDAARGYRAGALLSALGILALAVPGVAVAAGGNASAGFAASPTDPAIAVGGGWVQFSWLGTGQPFDQEGSFGYTSAKRTVVTVTDDFCRGDVFRVFDGATALGDTSTVPVGPCDDVGPDAAYKSSTYSHGSFLVDPGSHAITTQVITNPSGYGEAWLRVDPPPACQVKALHAGPPTRLLISVQSPFPGLQSITQTQAVNATVSVPAFSPGARGEVVVKATKTDQAKASHVALLVTDTAGDTTACDPVVATVVARLRHGRPAAVRLARVPAAESTLTIANGRRGLRALRVAVNGRRAIVVRLGPAGSRTVHLGRAMRRGGRNTVSLTPIGRPGRRADVLLAG